MRLQKQQSPYFAALCSVLLWGVSFALVKISVLEIPPFIAVWLRLLFALPLLFIILILKKEVRCPTPTQLLHFLFLGGLGVTIQLSLQAWALRFAGVANSNWLVATTPSLVALLGWVFLREKLKPIAIIGLLVSGLGVLLVLGFGTVGMGFFSNAKSDGDLVMFLSIINWAIFQIFSRKAAQGVSPIFSIFWMYCAAIFLQTLLVLATGGFQVDFFSITAKVWGALAFTGILCSGVAFLCWYSALAVLPAVQVSAFQFAQPLFGAIAAYTLMGERFTLFLIVGGALIFSGIFLINRGRG